MFARSRARLGFTSEKRHKTAYDPLPTVVETGPGNNKTTAPSGRRGLFRGKGDSDRPIHSSSSSTIRSFTGLSHQEKSESSLPRPRPSPFEPILGLACSCLAPPLCVALWQQRRGGAGEPKQPGTRAVLRLDCATAAVARIPPEPFALFPRAVHRHSSPYSVLVLGPDYPR